MRNIYVFCDFETTGLPDFKDNFKEVYPIEVGLIFTDENYVIYDKYERLIRWSNLEDKLKQGGGQYWPEKFNEAYNVHKIEVLYYLLKSVNYKKVSKEIFEKINIIRESCKKHLNEKVRFILISDNIQFEFRFMEMLLRDYCIDEDLNWPFHYCGYDSSEFLIKTGVGDPKPEHRALRDAALLHQHMIRAAEKIDSLNKKI